MVFVIKYRRRVLTGPLLIELEDVFRAILADLHADLTEFNGEPDHVHLSVSYPPNVAVGELARRLKGGSSHYLRARYPQLTNRPSRTALWTSAYFAASAGGAPLDIIRRYIQQQERPK